MSLDGARAAPRCGARTRSGSSCLSPAMPNGRCRMHGGKSTGPRTADGLARLRAALTKHGGFTAEMDALRAMIRELKAEQKVLREKV